MSADEKPANGFDDLPDLADGDDRPGLEDDLEYFDDDQTEYDDDDDDYPEDATEDDLDYAVAVYRDDGEPCAQPLPFATANDLEELIEALRRLPGDGGALGILSILEEFFVIVRVRGRLVQTFLSDIYAANDWPIARDIVDFLEIDVPDEDDDDDASPVGDFDVLADLGVSELDLRALASDEDESTDELGLMVFDRINLGEAARTVVEAEFS